MTDGGSHCVPEKRPTSPTFYIVEFAAGMGGGELALGFQLMVLSN
jgi:hypothetical protein